jgi:alpha-mannosidase
MNTDERPVLHLICQAHLDPVWLWRWPEGFAEVLTTLQSAVDRLREFPEMKYVCSSAAFYRWVQKTDPRLFEEIQAFIKEGRWEVVGGWIVQADNILPAEVSLYRQGLLGQEWFRRNLDASARVGYCVDSFGHSAVLPSALSAAGMQYYVFQRPDPRERPDLPNLFWWEGPDGARVLTWRLARGYGQPPACTAAETEEALRDHWGDVLADGMAVGAWFVGIGNHGGGPTKQQVQRLCELAQENDPTLPALRFSTLSEFFADLQRQPAFGDLPVVEGELLHNARGCYVANSRFKRLHRQVERELCNTETILQLRDDQTSAPPIKQTLPPAELQEAWWTLCFNQFHDILPGSSIPVAYEDARDQLGAARHTARRLRTEALHAMARRTRTLGVEQSALYVLNPLPWARSAVVQLDTFVSPHEDAPITHLKDLDGEELLLQWADAESVFGPHHKDWKKLVAVVPLESRGSRSLQLLPGEKPTETTNGADTSSLRNVAESLRFVIVDDQADTWGHDFDSWPDVKGYAETTKQSLLDDGPVFRRQRRWLKWGHSTIVMDIVEWHALSAVELRLSINWQDRYETLKLEMPLTLSNPRLAVKASGVVVDRPLDGNEWFWGDWLSIGGDRQRFVMVSDGTSAYDATAERLRLTLLRCVPYALHKPVQQPATSSAPFLDEGWQQARFWLTEQDAQAPVQAADRFAEEMLTPAEYMLDNGHKGLGD